MVIVIMVVIRVCVLNGVHWGVFVVCFGIVVCISIVVALVASVGGSMRVCLFPMSVAVSVVCLITCSSLLAACAGVEIYHNTHIMLTSAQLSVSCLLSVTGQTFQRMDLHRILPRDLVNTHIVFKTPSGELQSGVRERCLAQC